MGENLTYFKKGSAKKGSWKAKANKCRYANVFATEFYLPDYLPRYNVVFFSFSLARRRCCPFFLPKQKRADMRLSLQLVYPPDFLLGAIILINLGDNFYL